MKIPKINFDKINFDNPKSVFNMPSSTSTCELCGRIFANKYLKEKHLEGHIESARKEGLVPHYVYDQQTGESKLIGLRSISD